MSEYWVIAVESALDEAGLSATDEQISVLAREMESAHEMHSEATGEYVFSANLRAAQEDELAKAKRELRRERDKIPCNACDGGTRLVPGMSGTMIRQTDCWKCGGTGRHD